MWATTQQRHPCYAGAARLQLGSEEAKAGYFRLISGTRAPTGAHYFPLTQATLRKDASTLVQGNKSFVSHQWKSHWVA